MKTSIIIPVFNEEKTISEVIKRTLSLNFEKEIIVVNDGSTDNTLKELEKFRGKIKLINLQKNRGKGFAVREGFKASSGDIIVILDADLELLPEDIPSLIGPIKNGISDVVFGSRFLKGVKGINFTYKLGNFFLTFFTNLIFKSNITDEATGFKVMKREIFEALELEAKGFEICPEMTAKLLNLGVKIHEVPVRYFPNKMKRKRIGIRDGIKAIMTLLKYRYFYQKKGFHEKKIEKKPV